MKKLILSLSLFLSFSSLVHAQWMTNGANTITSTTNSVGIGTTTPDEKLVVSGNIKSVLSTYLPDKNVATIKQLDFSGPTGAMNWTIRGVYQYANGVGLNTVGGDLDLIKSWNGNTILGTKTDGTPLGNVGIGTTAPTEKLSITGGNVLISNATWYSSKNTSGTTVSLLGLANDNNIYIGDLFGNNSTGNLILRTNGNDKMMINSNGNISIGTNDSKGYKFAVNGSAIATSMTVKLNSAWPDYVFKKDYQLPSLQEVKDYIDQNQHLPEIPSEEQIAKEGLNLGEMNKLLMKKVEELTLYLIEKDDQIKNLEKRLNKLEK